jgi:SAM-dependent methyltransferase
MELHERIRRLLDEHRIERAHFVGGGFVHQLTELAVAAPDLIASLMLVCPFRIPLTLGLDLRMPLSLVSGDRGRSAEMVHAVLSDVPDQSCVVLSDCEPMLWDDIALERTGEVLGAITDFLSRVDREVDLPTIRSADTAGIVEELSYRCAGAGRPVVLFPLGLAPSQWEPILHELGKRYATLSVSGVHTAPISILEERASTPGYRSMLESILDRLRPAPGAPLLEVGCGCGAVSRWLAEQTRRSNPITGVDLNRFLLSEAAVLRDSAGFSDEITFEEGDAHHLPFDDASFDATVAVTLLEEVDADRAIAEIVRVTRPGGRIGVAVRALDIEPIVGTELPAPVLERANAILKSAGVGPNGCADASLYRRMDRAGLTDIHAMPQFNSSHHLMFRDHGRSGLDGLAEREREVWIKAVEEAGDGFFIAQPMHVAVGTRKPG